MYKRMINNYKVAWNMTKVLSICKLIQSSTQLTYMLFRGTTVLKITANIQRMLSCINRNIFFFSSGSQHSYLVTYWTNCYRVCHVLKALNLQQKLDVLYCLDSYWKMIKHKPIRQKFKIWIMKAHVGFAFK